MKIAAPSLEQSYFNIRYHENESHCAITGMKTSHIYLPLNDVNGKMSLEKDSYE